MDIKIRANHNYLCFKKPADNWEEVLDYINDVMLDFSEELPVDSRICIYLIDEKITARYEENIDLQIKRIVIKCGAIVYAETYSSLLDEYIYLDEDDVKYLDTY